MEEIKKEKESVGFGIASLSTSIVGLVIVFFVLLAGGMF